MLFVIAVKKPKEPGQPGRNFIASDLSAILPLRKRLEDLSAQVLSKVAFDCTTTLEKNEMTQEVVQELETFMAAFVEAVRREFIPDDAVLERATFRWEYRKCRKGKAGWWSDCRFCRYGKYCQGPYLYLYWKEKGKLKKKYLGKGPEEYLSKKVEKCYSHFARLGNFPNLLSP
jgi:hypothetical protein